MALAKALRCLGCIGSLPESWRCPHRPCASLGQEGRRQLGLVQLILTWQGRYNDQEGCLPRARLGHCTPVVLTPANGDGPNWSAISHALDWLRNLQCRSGCQSLLYHGGYLYLQCKTVKHEVNLSQMCKTLK